MTYPFNNPLSNIKKPKTTDETNLGSEKTIGENGTQVNSKTTWQNGKTERIDVDNPAPGKRSGQIHYHDANNKKWYYDIESNCFYDNKTNTLAPNKTQDLLKDKNFMNGIEKAKKFLENKIKIKMNTKMKNIIAEPSESINKKIIIDFCKNYVLKTKKVKDCIIYDEDDNLEENQIDFKKVLQFDGDLTGYEAGCYAKINQRALYAGFRKFSA